MEPTPSQPYAEFKASTARPNMVSYVNCGQ